MQKRNLPYIFVIVCQPNLIYAPAATQYCSYKLVYVYVKLLQKAPAHWICPRRDKSIVTNFS